jgi:hypothetical protein
VARSWVRAWRAGHATGLPLLSLSRPTPNLPVAENRIWHAHPVWFLDGNPSVFLNDVAEINPADLHRWLKKAKEIQCDYKSIVKRKGRLEVLK